jgi:hypothetical protein
MAWFWNKTFQSKFHISNVISKWSLFWVEVQVWSLKVLFIVSNGVPYIIGKLLEPKCLKWARIVHLDIWNTNYGQKKGWKSNWQFDSRPLKVKNRSDLFICRWRVTYHWKTLNEGYNFALDFISIGSVFAKLWRPKVARIPIPYSSNVFYLGLTFESFKEWECVMGITNIHMSKKR